MSLYRNGRLVFVAGSAGALLICTLVRSIASLAGEIERMRGELVPESVRLASPCVYEFVIEKAGLRMPVRYATCVLSDPFATAVADGDRVEMTLEGERDSIGFLATNVAPHMPSCCYCTAEGRKEQLATWRQQRRSTSAAGLGQ